MRRLSQSPGKREIGGELCLECGLCCNGVLFADVKLKAGETALKTGPTAAGLMTGVAGRGRIIPQPCPAFDGCRCGIYPDRPSHCRNFECLLLRALNAGETRFGAARRVVREARRRVEKVEKLLVLLGDKDPDAPLRARFRRTQKRLERAGAGESDSSLFGELTLAMHDLIGLLSEKFFR